jgi:hypothetical protein
MVTNPAKLTLNANLGRHSGGEQQVGAVCFPKHAEQGVDADTDRVGEHRAGGHRSLLGVGRDSVCCPEGPSRALPHELSGDRAGGRDHASAGVQRNAFGGRRNRLKSARR